MSGHIESTLTDTVHLQSLIQLQQGILDTLPIPITVYEIIGPSEWRLAFINRSALQPDAGATTDVLGLRLEEIVPAATATQIRQRFQTCIDTGVTCTVEDSYELPTGVMWTKSTFAPIPNSDGRITHLMVFWEDITESRQREQEDRQRQEEIIEQQQATLAELSTPFLAISDTTVVMPLVGAVDSRRVGQMIDTLLAGVADSRASTVILDITGVAVVDTQVANAFIRASQAVSLLGAQVILTGIRAEVAQTLVGLGVDLRGIITRSTLRDGITYALRN